MKLEKNYRGYAERSLLFYLPQKYEVKKVYELGGHWAENGDVITTRVYYIVIYILIS